MESLFVNADFLAYMVIMWIVNLLFVALGSRMFLTPLKEKSAITVAEFRGAYGRATFIGVLPFILIWLLVSPVLFGADVSLGFAGWLYYAHWIEVFLGAAGTYLLSETVIIYHKNGMNIISENQKEKAQEPMPWEAF
ncbi:MAG: hypothetical protein GF309_07005 [Candidatus Lokiarchaeota archaeon]|nr:hypothetical protein [Candidatus Lokiarchaeota archaeon]